MVWRRLYSFALLPVYRAATNLCGDKKEVGILFAHIPELNPSYTEALLYNLELSEETGCT